MKRQITPLVLSIIVLFTLGQIQVAITPTEYLVEKVKIVEKEPELVTKAHVIGTIVMKANEHGVKVDDALRIAKCESGFNAEASNTSGSTAKGVYQFIDGTWQDINANGHQFDYQENIEQFMIHYPDHPEWWECK